MKKAIIIIMALLMTATLIPATALADGETISVTGGTSAAAEYGDTFVYIAPQITVSSPDNINAASVAISDLPGDCTIGYTNKPASVAVTVRSDNKVVTVTGNASAADYQQALRGIYINVGTTTANVTFDIGISVDNALFYGSNKHYYEFVPAMGIGWEAAAAAASAIGSVTRSTASAVSRPLSVRSRSLASNDLRAGNTATL